MSLSVFFNSELNGICEITAFSTLIPYAKGLILTLTVFYTIKKIEKPPIWNKSKE